jgi:hypothetical protein
MHNEALEEILGLRQNDRPENSILRIKKKRIEMVNQESLLKKVDEKELHR